MSTLPWTWCYQRNYAILWTGPAHVTERTTTVSTNNACVHTAGPWTVDDGEITASGFVLGLVYGTEDYPCSEDETREECQANARLIAAAPLLLEACTIALTCLKDAVNSCTWKDGKHLVAAEQAIAIIREATGQP